MHSRLADFIERNTESLIAQAMEFAQSVDVGEPLEPMVLRDHLPEIIQTIVADLRTPQTRKQEIDKSEGRAPEQSGHVRSAAGTHALHRAHSGYSISHLVSEYRALRASVMRAWADEHEPMTIPGEVTRFNEAIDEAIAESVSHYAAEVERWRNIFLGMLGHDLRSPLNAILMTSELIARTAIDGPIAVAAQRLTRSGERMGELLDQLLAYNRAQIGIGFQIEKVELDLVHACREEIEILRASMPTTRIVFESPRSLRGGYDGGRIREALANLVVNASKYGTTGGDIQVELRDRDTRVELAVVNLGTIAGDRLDMIFDPLTRAAVTSGEAERTSLGLGLFIVSQIAQAHGGTVRGESSNGKTTFTLQWPKTGA